MEQFFQAVGVILVTVIMSIALDGHARHTAIVLGIFVCVMVLMGTVKFIEPVISFLETLKDLTGLENAMMVILFKSAGICLISEIAAMICAEAGNASLGKALQILSGTVILWLSLPLFESLLDLVQKLLERV